MALDFAEVGGRLRAYRLGRGLTADDVAATLGISRAAVYRLEKGELVKIETLERLGDLLETSLPSLLGVGVEYHTGAVAFFERMRQLDARATNVVGNFSPISLLLLSDDYMAAIATMLLEATSETDPNRAAHVDRVGAVLEILSERRRLAARRRVPIVSIVNVRDIERLLRNGLVGRFGLPDAVVAERRALARAEIERLAAMAERQAIGVQIGVVDENASAQTFQIFGGSDGNAVTLSPYRMGDHPNIAAGVAMITAAPEAVRLFEGVAEAQWAAAHKGEAGARLLRTVLAATA